MESIEHLLGKIHQGDNLIELKKLPDNCIDSCVTDPPYGLQFMGQHWDSDVPKVDIWREVLRVLKPGAHLLSFFGTRTYHRGVIAIEDAGFEIRDQIGWAYASGFPKSHDISKGIDKQAGAERMPILDEDGHQTWTSQKQGKKSMFDGGKERPATYPATYWQGWGTALKPAWEPICVARKPISEDTIAANVLKWGTGGINIDGCRIGTEMRHNPSCKTDGGPAQVFTVGRETVGRWPANLIHDGSEEVLHARFFYTAKVSKWDRNEDCEGMEVRQSCGGGDMNNPECAGAYGSVKVKAHNFHPTVKPTDLMQYLCRLVTPPDGIVLDPYAGSGSTGKAALLECFRFVGFEREAEYCKIANARIKYIKGQLKLF